MHKEGLETYKDLIKIFILLICISIRQDWDIEITIIGSCMSPCIHNNLHDQLNYNFHYSLQLYLPIN